MEQINCPVCLEPVGVARVTLECGHIHCVRCFTLWCRTSNSCTCCRAKFIDSKPTHAILNEELMTGMIYEHCDRYKNRNHTTYSEIIALCKNSTSKPGEQQIIHKLNTLVTTNIEDILQEFYEPR